MSYPTLIDHLRPLADPTAKYAGGELLFHAGTISDGPFIVESGQVRLERLTPSGDAVTVHRTNGPTLLAEASLWSAEYHCDAIANDTVAARCIPRAELANALNTNTELATLFNAHLAREVMDLRQRVELLCIRSATERVRTHLTLLAAEDAHVAPGFVIRQLAAEIGFTPETYSRALKQLADDGAIRRKDDGSIELITHR